MGLIRYRRVQFGILAMLGSSTLQRFWVVDPGLGVLRIHSRREAFCSGNDMRRFLSARLKRSVPWALMIESFLFFSGIYTGAITSGAHDPLAAVFAFSQLPGIILMGPITFVLSEVLAESHVNRLVWTGVFVIQTLWFGVLLSGLTFLKDRMKRKQTP